MLKFVKILPENTDEAYKKAKEVIVNNQLSFAKYAKKMRKIYSGTEVWNGEVLGREWNAESIENFHKKWSIVWDNCLPILSTWVTKRENWE